MVRRFGLLAVGLMMLAGPVSGAVAAPPVNVSGVIQLLHADPADPAAPPHFELMLRTASGRFVLHRRAGVTLVPGAFMTLRGRLRGRVLVVAAARRATPRSRAERRLAAPVALAGAAPKLAAVLINFSSDTRVPFSADTVGQALFGGGGSVASYYLEQSFGQTRVTGTVFGWYTIAASPATCDYATWAAQARAAAGSALNPYDHVMYIFPTEGSCAWAGLGDLPGPEAWINGYLQLRVMAHEFGHNLGVHHANSLSCSSGGVRTSLAGTCSSVEYGDPFSVMGTSSTLQFPAFHKAELGWLARTASYTVAASGTYTVAPSEDASATTQLLRIPRGTDALYIDFRQPFGTYFDTFTPGSAPVSGVMIRRGPTQFNRTQPALVDATPQTSTYQDAALAVGSSLTDPVTGIVIHTDAVSPDGATVTVTVPGPAQAPGAPPGVDATSGTAGVDVAWQAATDDGTILHYKVFRDGSLIATLAGTARSYRDVPPIGGPYTYVVTAVDDAAIEGPAGAASPVLFGDFTPPTAPTGLAATVDGAGIALAWQAATDDVGVTGYRVARDGVQIGSSPATSYTDLAPPAGVLHTYVVTATDAAGNASAGSPPATAAVPDTTAPSPPASVRVVTRFVPLQAALSWRPASDDVGVTGYRVWRDGMLVATVQTTAYTDGWAVLVPSVTYEVAATDAAGHESTRAVVVAPAPVPDVVAPVAPAPLRVTRARNGSVALRWGPGRDDVGVVRYEVVYRGRVVRQTPHLFIVIPIHARRGTRLLVGVRAVDAAGNRSPVARVRARLR